MAERNVVNGETRAGQASGDEVIAREKWGQFFRDFTQQHRGWLVTVEEQGDGNRKRVVVEDQPLQALSYEMDGDRIDVRVVVGNNSGESLAHLVNDARSIHLLLDRQRAHEGLRIRSPQGVTNVRFRSPARPDTVNGLP